MRITVERVIFNRRDTADTAIIAVHSAQVPGAIEHRVKTVNGTIIMYIIIPFPASFSDGGLIDGEGAVDTESDVNGCIKSKVKT